MRQTGTLEELPSLTEQSNPLSEDIDVKSSLEIVEVMNREDGRVHQAVQEAKASIATTIDWVAESFWNGGRLFYVGAGTSGRLGQLDASECPPTFGVPATQVQAIIAGGSKALIKAIEGIEDDAEKGSTDLQKQDLNKEDVVIGISSASTTPYVRGALAQARQVGCKTVLITSTPLKERGDFVDLVISLLTGPEVISGSTRLKAGSATKMALNMISTGAMIRTGRTYGNLMVDLNCSNRKLVKRGIRMIRSVTQLSESQATRILKEADGNVKTAIAMAVTGASKTAAQKALSENHGFLRRMFQWPHKKNSKIKAVIFDMDGTLLHYSLPTGFSTWAALGWAFGIYDRMEAWVDDYLNKKIDYEDIWKNCALEIKGKSFAEVKEVLFPCSGTPPYSRGFQDCAKALRTHYTVGIVSSGISLVSEEVRKNLTLDFELSNTLGVSQGKFDGTYKIGVHFNHKLDSVTQKAKELGLTLSQICFVGDSPNDIATLKAVGLPVAYNPKTKEVIDAAKGNVIGDFLQLPKLIESY